MCEIHIMLTWSPCAVIEVRTFFFTGYFKLCISLFKGYGEYLQTILVQPKSVEVPVGETVILDCTVFNQYGGVAW